MTASLTINGHCIPIFEEYLIDEVDRYKAFKQLERYFNLEGKKYHITVDEVKRAVSIAQTTFSLYDTVSKKNRDWLTDFATRLPDLSNIFYKIDEMDEIINRLVAIYIKSPLISESMTNISLFLTPAHHYSPVSSEALTRAVKICGFMTAFFSKLPSRLQKDIKQTEKLLSLYEESGRKKSKHYETLKALFNEITATEGKHEFSHINLTSDESSNEEKEPENTKPDSIEKLRRAFKKLRNNTVKELKTRSFHEALCELTESQQLHLEKRQSEHEAHQSTLTDHINDFFCRTIIHFYRRNIFNQPHSNEMMSHFEQRLKTLFPLVSSPIFMQEPRLLSRLEKQLIEDALIAFENFIKDYTTSINQTNDVVKGIYSCIRKQLKIPANEPFGPDKLQPHILDRVRRILDELTLDEEDRDQAKSDQDQFLQLMLAPPVVELINRLTRPDTVAFVLNRLLRGNVWKADPSPSEPPTQVYFASDVNFSKAIGTKIAHLGRMIFQFGRAQGTVAVVGRFIVHILDHKHADIGAYIQKLLNQITSSECIVQPFRIADLLLFEHGDNDIEAEAARFFNQPKEEREKLHEELRAFFEQEFLPNAITQIRSNWRGSGFVFGFKSVKEFCKVFNQRIWTLLENEDLLRALAFYLLDGVQRSLKTENRRKQYDQHEQMLSSSKR